jgi:hypothetical protein
VYGNGNFNGYDKVDRSDQISIYKYCWILNRRDHVPNQRMN